METMVGFSSHSPAFGGVTVVLVTLLLVLWFVVATTAALKGAGVEQPNRMAQMYGYTVCLVSVVIAITTLSYIVDAAFDRAHPLQNEYPFGVSLISFEAYKATHARERMMMGPQNSNTPDTSSDSTLRLRYNALVDDRVAATSYRTTKTLVTNGILFVVALILFIVHWRWLARLSVTKWAAG